MKQIDFETLAKHSRRHKIHVVAYTQEDGAEIQTANLAHIHHILLYCVTCDKVLMRLDNPDFDPTRRMDG